jgi:hypothetical protein
MGCVELVRLLRIGGLSASTASLSWVEPAQVPVTTTSGWSGRAIVAVMVLVLVLWLSSGMAFFLGEWGWGRERNSKTRSLTGLLHGSPVGIVGQQRQHAYAFLLGAFMFLAHEERCNVTDPNFDHEVGTLWEGLLFHDFE